MTKLHKVKWSIRLYFAERFGPEPQNLSPIMLDMNGMQRLATRSGTNPPDHRVMENDISRIGFKGCEFFLDLGKAIFEIENQLVFCLACKIVSCTKERKACSEPASSKTPRQNEQL